MKNLSISSSVLRQMILSHKLGRVLWALLTGVVSLGLLSILLISFTDELQFWEPRLLHKTTYLVEHVAAQSTTAISQTVRLAPVAQWFSADTDLTSSVAWGDVDGDGTLDLAVGNRGQPNKLYLNRGGVLQTTAAWVAQNVEATMSVAWSDVDGDGDLDLAVGNWSQPNKLYLNRGGVLQNTPVWSSNDNDNTTSVAWGDANGDGYLDLAVGNWGQPNKLYLNIDDGTGRRTLNSTGTLISSDSARTSSIAWADMDRDGDLDLAVANYDADSEVANYQGNSKVYCNDGKGLFMTPACWSHRAGRYTYSVAWGDMDGNGYPDLAFGNAARKDNINDKDPIDMQSFDLGEPSLVFTNTTGMLAQQPAWSSPARRTLSVAWGDVDSDGDLDLVAGNWYGLLEVYLNQDGKLQSQASWLSSGMNRTFDVAWGDVNGDGDLDLAVANYGQASQVYRNDSGGMATHPSWTSSLDPAHRDFSEGIAWGDVDGDNDLDLAAVNQNGNPNRVYRNQNGMLETGGITVSFAVTGYSLAVAWGDMDGDGDLDLAVGNSSYDKKTPANPTPVASQANEVYLYQEGKLQNTAAWSSQEISNTASVAWGDMDGDGDLDLVAGNYGESNNVYLNVDGMLQRVAIWSSLEKDDTTSVAWGDMDGDSDLDLAVGNMIQPVRVYINERGILRAKAAWSGLTGDKITGVAWGDMEGDGDLDLAVANAGQPKKIYNNKGGTLQTDGVWSSYDNDFSSSVSWGDIDGDGDLDIAVGNNGANKIYWNENGELQRAAGWSSLPDDPADYTVSSALGDMNGDGYLDFAGGGVLKRNQLYLNRRPVSPMRSSQAPTIRVHLNSNAVTLFNGNTSTSLAPANFYAVPGIRQASSIPITYTLFHPTGEPVRRLQAFYSPDGGARWYTATATNDTVTTNLTTSPYPTMTVANTHVYTWDLLGSGFLGQSDNVVIRLVAYAQHETITGTYRYTNTVAGPYQWPYASATTFPFRVRGTQVRVLQEGQPQANALVYRLPAGQNKGALPLANTNSLTPFRTDSQGYLQGRGQIAIGDTLVALSPSPLPPTLTAHYSDTLRFYLTNAAPGVPGQEGHRVTQPGVQTLTVSAQHPILLFDLVVALEWDARKDTQYLAQLEFNLKRTSELIYTWSHGQAALGKVTVYHDAPNYPAENDWQPWQDAHIRIYASNRLRPNAVQGGIISDTLTEIGARGPITYTTGQVRMGAIWNRYGEAGSNLVEDWSRALAHELGHFLFFLEDNYLGLNNQGLLISVATCPGVMSDPYSDALREFHPRDGWRPNCEQTLSHQETGRADWQTMQKFYPMLHAPSGLITKTVPPPPNGLPLAVTQVTFQAPITPVQTLDLSLFALIDSGAAATPSSRARVILYQGDQLIDLGRPTLDQVQASGARPGDELCVYDWDEERLGCKIVLAGNNQLTLTVSGAWQPDIIVTPVTSVTLQVTVTGVGALAANEVLYARFFPLDEPATAPIVLTGSAGRYTGVFSLPQPTLGGFIRVWVGAAADAMTKAEPLRDQITDFSLGGNPVPTPQKKRPAGQKRKKAPLLSPDGEVTLYGSSLTFAPGEFYALQATSAITPPVWATVVGQAYRLIASPQAPALVNASLSFDYLGDEVPAGEEKFLHIYFWETKPNACDMQPVPCWRLLPTNLDVSHNVASAAVQGPGLYALMSSIELPLQGGGWNNFGYTVQNTQPVTTALQSIVGKYSVVWGYNATANVDGEPWQFYAPNAPSWVSKLSTFEFGQGYWLYITDTNDVTLYLKGADNVRAAAVNNASLLPAVYYGTLLPSTILTPAAGMTLTAWIDGIACGQTQTEAQADQIVYVVRVAADTGRTPPVCGLLHESIITFTLDGQPLTAGAALVDWDNTKVQAVSLQAFDPTPLEDGVEPPPPDVADMTHFLFLPVIGNEPGGEK